MQKSKLGLLLAAVAAYGVYRFSKMTPEQKNNLKAKGKDLLNKNLDDVNNLFGKKKATMDGNGF